MPAMTMAMMIMMIIMMIDIKYRVKHWSEEGNNKEEVWYIIIEREWWWFWLDAKDNKLYEKFVKINKFENMNKIIEYFSI